MIKRYENGGKCSILKGDERWGRTSEARKRRWATEDSERTKEMAKKIKGKRGAGKGHDHRL
jgi:hypothetical protein